MNLREVKINRACNAYKPLLTRGYSEKITFFTSEIQRKVKMGKLKHEVSSVDRQTWPIYYVHVHKMLFKMCMRTVETEMLTGASRCCFNLFSSSYTPTPAGSNCYLIQIKQLSLSQKKPHKGNKNQVLLYPKCQISHTGDMSLELRQPVLLTAAPVWCVF